MNSPRTRRAAVARGVAGEDLVARALRDGGWLVRDRNCRCGGGELDLVAERDGEIRFVEVKARGDFGTAAQSLRPRQAGRIVRAAGAFIQSRPALSALDQRFDVILVVPWKLPVHLGDAWRPEL